MNAVQPLERPKFHWLPLVLRGIVAILFGGAILAMPRAGVAALVFLFGIYAIVDGIFALMVGAPKRTGLLAAGVLSIMAGIAAFALPVLTAITLIYVIAIWGILHGAGHLFDAFRNRKAEGTDWLMALAGVAAIGLGVYILAHPAWGLLTVVVAAGVYAIISGIFFVATGFRAHSLKSKLREHGRLASA